MNVAPQAVLATEPVTSEGVVAAGAYVDGRRVANIAVEDAAGWRSPPRHPAWIAPPPPDLPLLPPVQRPSHLHDLAIATPTTPIRRPKIEQYGAAVHRRAHRATRRRKHIRRNPFVRRRRISCLGPSRPVNVLHAGAGAAHGAARAARTTPLTRSSILIVDNYSPVPKPFRNRSKQ